MESTSINIGLTKYEIVKKFPSNSTGGVFLVCNDVHVYVVKCDSNEVLTREVSFLTMLSRYDCFPKVIEHNTVLNQLVISCCGEELTAENCPADYQYQINAILNVLREHEICHNDIRCSNICVLNGKIYLIDFGYSTIRGGPSHSSITGFPASLGNETRKNVASHFNEIHFDDVRSFKYVLYKLGKTWKRSDHSPPVVCTINDATYGCNVEKDVTEIMQRICSSNDNLQFSTDNFNAVFGDHEFKAIKTLKVKYDLKLGDQTFVNCKKDIEEWSGCFTLYTHDKTK